MIYLFLLLISFLGHWQWVTDLSILTSGDWVYQDALTLKEFLAFPSPWSPAGLGAINLGISFTPFLLVYGWLSQFNIFYGWLERIVFLWPILIAFPICSYLLLKKLFNNTVAAAVGSFIYCYNTYFFELKTGQLTLLIAFAFFPLVFLFYRNSLKKRKILYSLLTGLVGFVISLYEFRAFYILCFLFFFFAIYYIFYVEKIKDKKDLLKISFLAGLPLVIDFLLNAYWLLPFKNTGALTSNAAFDRSLFGNEFLDILQAFTLHHPFWTGAKTAVFEVQPIPVYFWIIPIAAFLGLYFKRKNKMVLFFGIISLLGIFLTKQVGQPFSGVYPWLYVHFPGFNAFREASKFYVFIALGYSVLIAAFVDWILTYFKKPGLQTFGKYTVVILLSGILLWNLKPVIVGDFATMFVPRHLPNDYTLVKNFLLKQDTYFRTYWIPTYSPWSFYLNNHPEISAVDQLEGSLNGGWISFIKNDKNNDKYTIAELIIRFLQKPSAHALLNTASVKYVIIPLEDKANDNDFFQYYGKDRAYYIKQVDKLPYLKKIDIGTKDILVYVNTDYKPHFYTTEQKSLVKTTHITSQSEIKTTSQLISPSKYRVQITHIKSPTYLQFAENYHPDWDIKVGDFNWWNALMQKNYFLSTSDHFKNDAGLNSYRIDPKAICSTYTCVKNGDGSYDITMTVYFKPESYMYLGTIVSGATAVIILLSFGAIGFKKMVLTSK